MSSHDDIDHWVFTSLLRDKYILISVGLCYSIILFILMYKHSSWSFVVYKRFISPVFMTLTPLVSIPLGLDFSLTNHLRSSFKTDDNPICHWPIWLCWWTFTFNNVKSIGSQSKLAHGAMKEPRNRTEYKFCKVYIFSHPELHLVFPYIFILYIFITWKILLERKCFPMR